MRMVMMVLGFLSLLSLPSRPGIAAERAMGGLSDMDRDFATKAAQGSMAEVEAGKMARDRAVNQSVKDFAQRMVKDHGKASNELTQLARKKGVTLPSTLADDQKGMIDKMTGQSGVQFDRAYMNAMVEDHEKDVELFRKEAQGTDVGDRDLRRWANKMLPILEDHLKNARVINDQLKANQAATR